MIQCSVCHKERDADTVAVWKDGDGGDDFNVCHCCFIGASNPHLSGFTIHKAHPEDHQEVLRRVSRGVEERARASYISLGGYSGQFHQEYHDFGRKVMLWLLITMDVVGLLTSGK